MTADSLLDVIEKSKGYEVALLSTFNYEIEYFEHAILTRLFSNGVNRVGVFVDASELTKALVNARSSIMGYEYSVNPVSINGAYHPKVILLLGSNKARVIVGSANIKLSGYCINNEVFGTVDYDADHPEIRSVIKAAIDFFIDSYTFTPRLDDELMKIIKQYAYYRSSESFERIRFISNYQEPIISQVKELIDEKVVSIKVCVPYYDNQLVALEKIHEMFPDARFTLYIQHVMSTFPEMTFAEKQFNDGLLIYKQISSQENKNSHFYHGKVFSFYTATSSYILYGSANCTKSALLASPNTEGNFECDLLIKCKREEGEHFYQNFIIEEDLKPASHLMVYEPITVPTASFNYGVVERDEIVLRFKYKGISKDISVLYGGKPLRYEINDEWLIAFLEKDLVTDTIFTVDISFDGRIESIRCWFVDNQLLKLSRIKHSAEKFQEYRDDYGEGDRYQEEYMRLLDSIACCADDLKEYQRLSDMIGRKQEVDDVAAISDDNDYDYVIEEDLSDDDLIQYKQIKVFHRIGKHISQKYLDSPPLYVALKMKQMKVSHDMSEEKPSMQHHVGRSLNEDQRFASFVRAKIKTVKDNDFINAVPVDHLFNVVLVLFSIFDSSLAYEGGRPLFTDKYVVTEKCQLMILLLQKVKTESVDQKPFVRKALDTVLSNHVLIDNSEDDDLKKNLEIQNRSLLINLQSLYDIKSNYVSILEEWVKDSDDVYKLAAADQAVAYIQSLFGYYGVNELQNWIKTQYGNSSRIDFTSNDVTVYIHSSKSEHFTKIDTALMKHLVAYSRAVSRINKVKLRVKRDMPTHIPTITYAEYKIDLDTHWGTGVLFYSNGNVRQIPNRYYEY